jgi:hypothetical protein
VKLDVRERKLDEESMTTANDILGLGTGTHESVLAGMVNDLDP